MAAGPRTKCMAGEQRARIVVVDDNPATLYSTSRVLRAAGFNVTEAINGEQALEFAGKGADLILLDVNLPDIHGFEVCRRLSGKSPNCAPASHSPFGHFRQRNR